MVPKEAEDEYRHCGLSYNFSSSNRCNLLRYMFDYRMYQKIQAKHDEEQQRFGDLMEAMVIATLLSAPSVVGPYATNKDTFLKQYKGQTQIFK